jgi:hypothetical protein
MTTKPSCLRLGLIDNVRLRNTTDFVVLDICWHGSRRIATDHDVGNAEAPQPLKHVVTCARVQECRQQQIAAQEARTEAAVTTVQLTSAHDRLGTLATDLSALQTDLEQERQRAIARTEQLLDAHKHVAQQADTLQAQSARSERLAGEREALVQEIAALRKARSEAELVSNDAARAQHIAEAELVAERAQRRSVDERYGPRCLECCCVVGLMQHGVLLSVPSVEKR